MGFSEAVIEDFEIGSFIKKNWKNDAAYPWVITDEAYQGKFAMKSSCEKVNDTTSSIEIEVDVPYDGFVAFNHRISSEDNADYGNFYIEDAEGNKILVYGTFAEDGETKYGDMEVKPVIGDTVTVYGPLGQYNGNAQMKNAFFVSAPADDEDDNDNNQGVVEDDEDIDEDIEDDKEEATSPETGDAVTAFAITAAILVATIMAAALLFTNKKKVTE